MQATITSVGTEKTHASARPSARTPGVTPALPRRLDDVKPAWLPALRALVRCAQAFEHFSSAHVRELGLTPSQFDVIATLGNTDGMSCRELSECTRITKGTLTGVLDRLEARNLLRREGVPGDARRLHIRLTEAGQALFARTFPAHLEHCGRAFGQLAADDLVRLALQLDHLCRAFERSSPAVDHPKEGEGDAV
ncbi:MAG: MarR family winged helix-turn-helix transcriptional regulator [Casimicrobiaceae bacterium]